MTSAGSTTYAYNKNGAMTSKTTGTTTTSYRYDFEGALTKADTVSYERDPFERAISSTVGTTTTDYLFDGSEAIREKTGTATTFYTRGLEDRLINRRGGGEPIGYYHFDAIGSVVGLTNSTADLTDTYAYNAFGGVRERTGTSTQPYQYVGNAYDSDAKLWDFHARAYDAGVGRFMSKDPVAGLATMPQTLNPYAYGVNGPLAYPDPSGKFPPALALAAPLAGRVALAVGADYAMNAAVSATHYMVTRPEDKPFSLEDFAYTVGGEALDLTIADLKNPLTLMSPLHKFDKISDVLRIANKGDNPLAGIRYTDKVKRQMRQDDYHGFPDIVDNYAGSHATKSTIVGKDGMERTKVEIPGGYKGKDGVFEYIIEPDGTVNHRIFKPYE
jgi:RHS repeat-associated protein